MTLHESSLIYSRHKTRGIFIILIVFSVTVPSALNLGLCLHPDTGEKNITVKFEYKGAFEKDIEKLISMLEQSLSALAGMESIYSVSEPEKGSVYCSFFENRDFDNAYMDVRDCVNRIYTLFPENVQRPVLLKSGLNNSPVFAASFNSHQVKDCKELERAFKKIKGCSDAETGGESGREIIISPDVEKIHSSFLNFSRIINRIRKENSRVVITPPDRKQIKACGNISGVKDIRKIYLSDSLKIKDFNSIIFRKKISDSEGRINGQKKLILYAMKEGGSSVVEVCRKLAKTAEKLGGEIVFSRGEEIEKALKETALSVAAGITAVIITALIYFRNISFSLIVILNIIFSITASAFFLKITGHNLDVISLSGMAVVSGLAIDNTIIFLEKYRIKYENIDEAIGETIYPLFFSLLTSCIVFLPLTFASLKLKIMFAGMAVSVSSGLSASFLFTFYFVPLFLNMGSSCQAKRTAKRDRNSGKFKERHPNNFNTAKASEDDIQVNIHSIDKVSAEVKPVVKNHENNIKETLDKLLYKLIRRLTLNKLFPELLLTVLLFSALYLFSQIEYRPFNFGSSNRLTILLEFPAGCSFNYLQKTAYSVESELLEYIRKIQTDKADSGSSLSENSLNIISLLMKIEKERIRFDIKTPEKKYLELIKNKSEILSQKYRDIYFHYPLSETAECNYDITVYGKSIEHAASDAYRLGRKIESISGSLKAVYHFKEPAEALKVIFNTRRALNSSIAPDSGAEYLFTLLSSPVISKYYSNGIERDIRFGTADYYTPENLKGIPLAASSFQDSKRTTKQNIITLKDIADFIPDFPPNRIYHRNRQRALSVSVSGVNGKKETEVINSILSGFDFSSGCRGEGGVYYSKKEKERGELILLILLSFLFIITVLVIQFESFKIPFKIASGIPASLIIPLALIKLTELDLTSSTFLALILSSGICINNAILILSPFKGKKRITQKMITSSFSEKTGAIAAASFTTILSILPLIINSTYSILSPFSIVLSSGIIGSLLILPLIVSSCCSKDINVY